MNGNPVWRRRIEYGRYVDKVLGAWMGKSAGGTIGAPMEGHKMLMGFTEANCWPKEIAPNDDLDIQLVWLEALQENGPWLDSETLARFWRDRCWYGFCEYGYYLLNVQRGIAPPLSGVFNNRYFKESMGCPIRSEIWGVVCPGNPALAAHYAGLDGCLDHDADGVSVHAERMLSAAAAEAFFADSIEQCIEAGLAQIPADSALATASRVVRDLCAEETDWTKIRRALVRRYGHRDGSRALVNQTFTQTALRLGGGDFGKTIVMAINCGWDTDCTAATAGALLGILLGASKIPATWRDRIGERVNSNIEVRHNNCLLAELADDCARIGVEVAQVRGDGRVAIDKAPQVSLRNAPAPSLSIQVRYGGEPVLWRERSTEVTLEIANATRETHSGSLILESPDGVSVSPSGFQMALSPGESQTVALTLRRDPEAKTAILWDKNLIEIAWTEFDWDKIESRKKGQAAVPPKNSVRKTFGLAGARQWKVYGPYWDVYDTTQFDECPFHNDRVVVNPAFIPGCDRAGAHTYVQLERPYLDEAALLRAEIPGEDPYDIEVADDVIDDRDLGGFTSESCYYLTRRIVSPEAMDMRFTLGATGPFVASLNGAEVLRWEKVTTWGPYDFQFAATLKEGDNRLVIKALRLTDAFRLSMTPIRPDAFKDRTKGVSMFSDQLGDGVAAAGKGS